MYKKYLLSESFDQICLFLQWRHLKTGPRTKEFILFASWRHPNCSSSGAKSQVQRQNKLSHCCYGCFFSCNRGSLVWLSYVWSKIVGDLLAATRYENLKWPRYPCCCCSFPNFERWEVQATLAALLLCCAKWWRCLSAVRNTIYLK